MRNRRGEWWVGGQPSPLHRWRRARIPHHGGVCEHVHFLARELRRRGHHLDIITSALGDGATQPGLIRFGRSVPVYGNGSLARITVGAGLRRQMRETLRDGGARLGAIVLLHDGDGYDPDGDRTQTARALPRIIDGLRERGFTLAPLAP